MPSYILLPSAVCCFVDRGILVQGRGVLLSPRGRDMVLDEPHVVLDELFLPAWSWGLPKSG